MQAETRNYIERGILYGGFLYAVFTNNLVQAFEKADDVNTAYMPTCVHMRLCYIMLQWLAGEAKKK